MMRPRLAIAQYVWALAIQIAVVTGCAGSARNGPPPAPSAAARAAPTCTLAGVRHETISIDNPRPGEQHEVYDLPDRPELWQPAPPDEAVQRFRAAVSARLGGAIGPRDLLRPTRAYAEGTREAREAQNAAKVLDGTVGSIVPTTCLETMLWNWQASRYPMLERPTEFMAFVVRGRGHVRVYLSGFGTSGGKIRSAVTDRVQADAAKGLSVIHVHNHPFLLNRVVGDASGTTEANKNDVCGALAPSLPDVDLYRRVNANIPLEAAWITNGFDSARFRPAEFEILLAAD